MGRVPSARRVVGLWWFASVFSFYLEYKFALLQDTGFLFQTLWSGPRVQSMLYLILENDATVPSGQQEAVLKLPNTEADCVTWQCVPKFQLFIAALMMTRQIGC